MRRFLSQTWLLLFSVPLYLKILGIGLLVTLLFGVITYYSIRNNLETAHYEMHAQPVLSLARSLAVRIERYLSRDMHEAIEEDVASVLENFDEARYVILLGPDGSLQTHQFNFPMTIPEDLMATPEHLCASCHEETYGRELILPAVETEDDYAFPEACFQAYAREGGRVLEVAVPVANGAMGALRVGMGDRMIAREVQSVTEALVLSMLVCLVVGQGLALVLVYILVRPVRDLVQATNRLRAGDFSSRARVYAHDEVGKLAQAFNLMASELERSRREVQEKERERTRLLDRIVQAQEDERKAVSRELHDQLGQSLSTLLLSFQNICRDTAHGDGRTAQLEDDMRGMIDQVRQLASDLRPSVLDDYGLESALEHFVRDLQRRAGIRIDCQWVMPPDAPRLPPRVEVTLYRVAQEALINTVRHAQAREASVVLLHRGNEVTLVVEDDGRGFDLEAVQQRDTMPLGLVGMRERVSLIGGDLRIESTPGHGAAVRIRIPLEV